MKTINDLVGINNLKIIQNDDWFKFSLESVLLPYFVTLNLNDKKILDLCTGNAPIPLVLSTKTKAKIIGVEIQKEIAETAVDTIKLNGLEDRIEIINNDVNNLKNVFEGDTFDVITVNPPYFKKAVKSTINENKIKAIARHEIKINLEQIINISKYLLKNNGKLAIVHRTERLIEIINILQKNNLEPKKIQLIYPKENSESNLVLIEAVKHGKVGLKFLNPLIIHNQDGTYKEEINRIFKGVE